MKRNIQKQFLTGSFDSNDIDIKIKRVIHSQNLSIDLYFNPENFLAIDYQSGIKITIDKILIIYKKGAFNFDEFLLNHYATKSEGEGVIKATVRNKVVFEIPWHKDIPYVIGDSIKSQG